MEESKELSALINLLPANLQPIFLYLAVRIDRIGGLVETMAFKINGMEQKLEAAQSNFQSILASAHIYRAESDSPPIVLPEINRRTTRVPNTLSLQGLSSTEPVSESVRDDDEIPSIFSGAPAKPPSIQDMFKVSAQYASKSTASVSVKTPNISAIPTKPPNVSEVPSKPSNSSVVLSKSSVVPAKPPVVPVKPPDPSADQNAPHTPPKEEKRKDSLSSKRSTPEISSGNTQMLGNLNLSSEPVSPFIRKDERDVVETKKKKENDDQALEANSSSDDGNQANTEEIKKTEPEGK